MFERGIINPNDYRPKIPYFLYNRVDLRLNKAKYSIPFTTDFGGDFFLKKVTLRWDNSGELTQGEAIEADPEPITQEQKWIDLDDAYQGSPGHAGTEIDPYDIADWQALIATQNTLDPGFDFTMLGKADYYDATGLAPLAWNKLAVPNYYRAADPWTNGPWRIQTNVPNHIDGPGVTITQGIINCYDKVTGYAVDFDEMTASAYLIDMWIYADRIAPQGLPYPDSIAMAGCVFSGRVFTNSGANYQDSIIVVDTLDGGGAIMTNCAFFYSSIGPFIVSTSFINCFRPNYSPVIPPGLPSWDEPDKTKFDILSIVKGNIPDSVFIGIPPYAGYTAGLFGEKRFGIGTGYFVQDVNTLPGEIRATLRKSSSHFEYFEEIDPHVFSSPCDNFDCIASAALSAVDADILSQVTKGSIILSQKSFNWLVERKTTIVLEITREPYNAGYPQWIDVIMEGYYFDENLKIKD